MEGRNNETREPPLKRARFVPWEGDTNVDERPRPALTYKQRMEALTVFLEHTHLTASDYTALNTTTKQLQHDPIVREDTLIVPFTQLENYKGYVYQFSHTDPNDVKFTIKTATHPLAHLSEGKGGQERKDPLLPEIKTLVIEGPVPLNVAPPHDFGLLPSLDYTSVEAKVDHNRTVLPLMKKWVAIVRDGDSPEIRKQANALWHSMTTQFQQALPDIAWNNLDADKILRSEVITPFTHPITGPRDVDVTTDLGVPKLYFGVVAAIEWLVVKQGVRHIKVVQFNGFDPALDVIAYAVGRLRQLMDAENYLQFSVICPTRPGRFAGVKPLWPHLADTAQCPDIHYIHKNTRLPLSDRFGMVCDNVCRTGTLPSDAAEWPPTAVSLMTLALKAHWYHAPESAPYLMASEWGPFLRDVFERQSRMGRRQSLTLVLGMDPVWREQILVPFQVHGRVFLAPVQYTRTPVLDDVICDPNMDLTISALPVAGCLAYLERINRYHAYAGIRPELAESTYDVQTRRPRMGGRARAGCLNPLRLGH